MPKHEAQQKLADYIEEFTGKLIHQGDAIESFADLWKAFSAVKAGSWGKKMREDMKYLFDKHVLPVLGQSSPRKITLTPLQLLLNKMAEAGYSKSAVKHIRTYLKGCFEYAIDEDLIPKNPAQTRTPQHPQKALREVSQCRRSTSSANNGFPARAPHASDSRGVRLAAG